MKYLIILLTFFVSNTLLAQKSEVVHPKWSKNVGIYEVNIRQYTPEGTFKAFQKYLPQLKELGVGILWIMPINPIGIKNRKGKLGSYYSIKDYEKVNPEFGSLEDFQNLVKNIHKNGMHVIIDWVANHTAWDNVWVKEHPEFYTHDSGNNFVPPVADWSDVIDLNYNNKELWKYMINSMKYWLEETDIDGFRCDVASMVPTEFWNSARKELNKIKPIFMLAEADDPELQVNAFDMTYNWQLKDLMNRIAAEKGNASDVVELFSEQQKIFLPNYYQMNFTTNHDENTWNGTVRERLGNGAECFSVLTFMLPGMPLLYSGQEYGLDKRLKFFDKDTIPVKKGKLFSLYSKLYQLKINNNALWNGTDGGTIKFIVKNASENVLIIERKKNNNKILSIFNLSKSSVTIKINEKEIRGNYSDVLSPNKTRIINSENLKLKPWDYTVLKKVN